MTVVIHETWAAIANRRKQSISYDGEKYGEKNAEIKEGEHLSFFLTFLTVYFDFLKKYYKLYVYCTGVSVITIVTLAVVLLPPFSAADFSKLEPTSVLPAQPFGGVLPCWPPSLPHLLAVRSLLLIATVLSASCRRLVHGLLAGFGRCRRPCRLLNNILCNFSVAIGCGRKAEKAMMRKGTRK